MSIGEWISVNNRLPEVIRDGTTWPRSDFVLCWCHGWSPPIHVMQAAFLGDGSFAGWVGPQSQSVTHWQPMPAAPQGEGE